MTTKTCDGSRTVLGGVVLAILLAAFLSPAVKAEVVTILGEVEVAEEDDEGNPVAVFVFDPEFDSVLVANGGKVAEILGLVGETVAITGTIQEQPEGEYRWIILPSSYEIVED